MSKVKFGDIVKDVKINVDRDNNPYEFYVAGDHMDSEDLNIRRRGKFATDDVGPAFTRIFKIGQVLYGSRRTYLKKVAVADFNGICANTTFVFESKDPAVFDQRLLPFLMLSEGFTNWSIAHSKGSTNPYVLFSDLASYEFPLPPLAEQKVLAEKLWAAYEVKQSYLKMIDASEEMVKSQFIEMFGDPVSWQTDTSLPTLNDTVNVISGFPFDSEKFNTEGVGTPLIRIRDIQRGYSETFTTEAFDEQYRIKKYELLVGMDGMFDIARWQSDEAALNQRVCCLRMEGSENDTFIQYLVQPILKHIENGTNATTVKHISTKQINGIRVPIASHEQKNKFAMIANQADKSVFELRKSVAAIDRVIKSLINENL